MKWVCFPKFHSPLANWPWLRRSPQSSLKVTYCLILTAWPWLLSFTCIPMQIEPNKSPLRKRVLALLLGEIGHVSSPSRSCLGRLIFILGKADTIAVTTPSNKTVLNDVKGKYGRPETRDGVGGTCGQSPAPQVLSSSLFSSLSSLIQAYSI